MSGADRNSGSKATGHSSAKRAFKKDFILTSVFAFIGLVYLVAALTPVWFLVHELVKPQGSTNSNSTTKAPPFAPGNVQFWSTFCSLAFLWPAISHFFMAAAYFGNQRMGVRCLNKDRKTGQIPCVAFFLSLPWLITVYIFWFLRHLFNGEDAYNQVYQHFFVGRFPSKISEFPPEIENIVDLTAEFSARPSLLKGRKYLCLPSMDRCMPEPRELGDFALRVSKLSTPTYIHCANGHSRSSLLMAMVMVLRKDSSTIRDAFSQMTKRRPWVRYRAYEVKQAVYTLATYCGVPTIEGAADDPETETEDGPKTRATAVHPLPRKDTDVEVCEIEHLPLKRGHTQFLTV